MRCLVTLKDGGAMERAVQALAKYRYAVGGEAVAPEGRPREWKKWLLEINAAEIDVIHDHLNDGDILEIKPVGEAVASRLH